jgi:hypothetical protein
MLAISNFSRFIMVGSAPSNLAHDGADRPLICAHHLRPELRRGQTTQWSTFVIATHRLLGQRLAGAGVASSPMFPPTRRVGTPNSSSTHAVV